ncbi:putative trehalose-phosphatase [Helianthus anomalus]
MRYKSLWEALMLSLSGKEINLFQPAREFIPMIKEVFRTLVELTKDIPGASVENHKFCTSVHYGNVDEKVRNSLVLHIVDVFLKKYSYTNI